MAVGNLAGRARTSITSPQAKGECDRCGFWFPLDRLRKQFEWQGVQLADTGYLVCGRCLDVPFEQNKTIILPPDPVPRMNPRVSFDITPPAISGSSAPVSPGNQGFTQYVLSSAIPGLYPTDKADVLSAVAALSGISTPGSYSDISTVLTPGDTSVLLTTADPLRSWLLLYNPTQAPAQFALASGTTWGAQGNLPIGPGEAYFWATAQELTPVYQGALCAIGLYPGLPLWAFEADG